jgi:hypothetical protein
MDCCETPLNVNCFLHHNFCQTDFGVNQKAHYIGWDQFAGGNNYLAGGATASGGGTISDSLILLISATTGLKEVRNPKSEIRKKSEGRNPKRQNHQSPRNWRMLLRSQ